MLALLRSLFSFMILAGYSAIFKLLQPLARILGRLSPKLRAQFDQRCDVARISPSLALERARYRHCAVFFCSSAGEFEQARPLISRLQALKTVYIQVIFFSKSGLDYAKARGETVPCCLSPLSDSVWTWGWLYSALLPDLTCVVRHELWPGFLTTARRFGKLYLLDASRSLAEKSSPLRQVVRSFLLHRFDQIYAVSAEDEEYFRVKYRISSHRLMITSDTKYDRVIERAKSRPDEIERLKDIFNQLIPVPNTPRLVVGSAYEHEVSLLVQAYKQRATTEPQWQIIIAPHIVTDDHVSRICGIIEQAGLQALRFSRLKTHETSRSASIIVVDSIGILAEIYGTAQAAFVGGALHHQVHNVLEPASHGLALAYGPFYKNSQEAIHLVQSGLAVVIKDPSQFVTWWRQLDHDAAALRRRMLAATAELTGASDRIFATWRPLLET